jgi:uncharacterized protein GlcG (DUF336 family)
MPRAIETLTLADARPNIAAGEAKAEQIGVPYNLAVVDAGGNLIAHVGVVEAAAAAFAAR